MAFVNNKKLFRIRDFITPDNIKNIKENKNDSLQNLVSFFQRNSSNPCFCLKQSCPEYLFGNQVNSCSSFYKITFCTPFFYQKGTRVNLYNSHFKYLGLYNQKLFVGCKYKTFYNSRFFYAFFLGFSRDLFEILNFKSKIERFGEKPNFLKSAKLCFAKRFGRAKAAKRSILLAKFRTPEGSKFCKQNRRKKIDFALLGTPERYLTLFLTNLGGVPFAFATTSAKLCFASRFVRKHSPFYANRRFAKQRFVRREPQQKQNLRKKVRFFKKKLNFLCKTRNPEGVPSKKICSNESQKESCSENHSKKISSNQSYALYKSKIYTCTATKSPVLLSKLRIKAFSKLSFIQLLLLQNNFFLESQIFGHFCGPKAYKSKRKSNVCIAKNVQILFRKRYSCKYNAIFPNIFWYSIYKTNYTIVRPLMNCLRSNITRASTLSGLPVYPDFSNLKMRYSRNRIRKQIIPAIKFFLNPKTEKAVFQFSEFFNKEIF